MATIKVVLADGTERRYPNAEAYVGGGEILHVVRKTAYGAETTLAQLPRPAYQRWESIEESH